MKNRTAKAYRRRNGESVTGWFSQHRKPVAAASGDSGAKTGEKTMARVQRLLLFCVHTARARAPRTRTPQLIFIRASHVIAALLPLPRTHASFCAPRLRTAKNERAAASKKRSENINIGAW
jgi:hypothetical protein